jgi:hypothetical protein
MADDRESADALRGRILHLKLGLIVLQFRLLLANLLFKFFHSLMLGIGKLGGIR